jgi:4-hydroxy-2-oxoheptanedioate aldolase
MLGIFSKTTDSNFIEAAGLGGLDFIILDKEHGPLNDEIIHHHVRAAALSNLKSIVRVRECNEAEIGAALDSGASGVQVPNILSAAMAKKAIEAARFAPDGLRGVCRFVRDAEFGNREKQVYFKQANSKMLVLQVEGKKGVEAIDEIIALKGFDVLFIGPYDLSQSLGIPGEVDHPAIFDLCKGLVKKVLQANLKLGVFVDNISQAERYRKIGFEYIAYSVDVSIFREGIMDVVSRYKALSQHKI